MLGWGEGIDALWDEGILMFRLNYNSHLDALRLCQRHRRSGKSIVVVVDFRVDDKKGGTSKA